MTSHPCRHPGRGARVAPGPGEAPAPLTAAGSSLGERALVAHPAPHVLTALYALAHRIGLTAEEADEVERTAPSLTGALWRETRALLRAADAGPDGTSVDLGYTPLVLRWLGLADGGAFEERHGVAIGEAIGGARGRLTELATALEGGAPAEDVRYALACVWCLRSSRLGAGLPETGPASAVALERALKVCPEGEDLHGPLLESLIHVCGRSGDYERAETARRRLAALERGAERRKTRESLLDVAAYVLSILWCLSHGDGLLASERGLDPDIEPSPETWARVHCAASAGQPEVIPLPVRTFAAWSVGEGLDEAVLRSALVESAGELPELVRALERAWRHEAPDAERSPEAARHVGRAMAVRRVQLERGWEPLPGERPDLQHELIQGAARPETAERFELMARVLKMLVSGPEADPMDFARLHLAVAADARWRGEHDEAARHLDEAAERARQSQAPPEERGEVEARLATFLFECAEPCEARRTLEAIGGQWAAEVLAAIEAKAHRREALRAAERVARDRGDAKSLRGLALAHAAAGHAARGEALALRCVTLAPEDPLAWATLARVLHRGGRYRDAVEPARTALLRGLDEAEGRVWLARILSRTGPRGRDEATALAVAAIDAHPGDVPLAGAELADLAGIAHGGGAPIERCRLADDRVWALRETTDRPEEWLGAAVARRCHGAWANDAPAWLEHLAEAADEEPVELARWLIERVEALQRFRLLAGRSLFGAVEGFQAEQRLAAQAEAVLAERQGHRAGPVGVDPDALPGGASAWEPHLAVIEEAFGEALVLRLRASERAQALLFGPDGAGERETAVALGAVEAEHAAWIRWAGTCEALNEVAAGHAGGLATGTVARLRPILDLAVSGDEEAVRSAAWPNRWHEAERRADDAAKPR